MTCMSITRGIYSASQRGSGLYNKVYKGIEWNDPERKQFNHTSEKRVGERRNPVSFGGRGTL